jgi:hypothetical protein
VGGIGLQREKAKAQDGYYCWNEARVLQGSLRWWRKIGRLRRGLELGFGIVNIDTRLVLVVEDSGDDAALLRIAFRKAGFDNPIQCVGRIERALEYLNGQGDFGDRGRFPFPRLSRDQSTTARPGHHPFRTRTRSDQNSGRRTRA